MTRAAHRADVVIAGAGLAGITAAIELLGLGERVILVEYVSRLVRLHGQARGADDRHGLKRVQPRKRFRRSRIRTVSTYWPVCTFLLRDSGEPRH